MIYGIDLPQSWLWCSQVGPGPNSFPLISCPGFLALPCVIYVPGIGSQSYVEEDSGLLLVEVMSACTVSSEFALDSEIKTRIEIKKCAEKKCKPAKIRHLLSSI